MSPEVLSTGTILVSLVGLVLSVGVLQKQAASPVMATEAIPKPLTSLVASREAVPVLTPERDPVKSSHFYLYSAFNNTDCVKALNSIKLEDRVSVMYNNKIKHSILS